VLRNLHATAVAKQGASRDFTRWIHGDDSYSSVFLRGEFEETRDKRAFADARRAGETNYMSRGGLCSQLVKQCERLRVARRATVVKQVKRSSNSPPLEAEERRDVDRRVLSGHRNNECRARLPRLYDL
jgi:hypothetical protein